MSRRLLLASCLLSLCLPALAAGQGTKSNAGTQLEDPLAPLVPRRPRTEAEEDRLRAAALFAAGRMLEQKGEKPAALRRYERAARYDADALPILREIIPLAFSLGRSQEAVRYALLAVEQDSGDPTLTRRLALYLAEQGDWERALRLYEVLLKELGGAKNAANAARVRMEAGRLYFLAEKFDKAAEQFAVVQDAIEHPQQFGLDDATRDALLGERHQTYRLFAESYLEAGKYERAAAAFREADEAEPNRGRLSFNLARAAAKQNNPAGALDLLRGYFAEKETGERVAPYELFAEILTGLHQEATLDAQLETLRAADPDNPFLTYFLARRYLDEKQYDKAEPLLVRLADKKDDAAPRASVAEALIELYAATDETPKLLDALADAVAAEKTPGPFEAAVEPLLEDEKQLAALFGLARGRREAGQKTPPGEALAVARLAVRAGKYDLADAFFPRALADEPERKAEILLTWGLDMFLADQYDAAARAFRRGAEEKALPDNPAFYDYLAAALEMAGKTNAALAAARKATRGRPGSARFASRAAWVEYHAERYDAARASYLKLLEKFDDQYESPTVREAMRDARLALSNIDVQRGDLDAAEEWLEQILDEYPEDIGAMNDLGYLWADQGEHLHRALRMIERAVAEQPDNIAYQDSLGWALHRLGRDKEAAVALEKAAAGEKPDPVILDHLGEVYRELGQTEKARAVWKRALEAFQANDNEENAQKIREKLKQNTPLSNG